MKKNLLFTLMCATLYSVHAQTETMTVTSPDNDLTATIVLQDGKPSYAIDYKGQTFIETSPLGLVTNVGDLSRGLSKFGDFVYEQVTSSYTLRNAKVSQGGYTANKGTMRLCNESSQVVAITFEVSNNNVALRYEIPQVGDRACMTITEELTGYKFPEGTTTFITPQAKPEAGWMRTKPSYEEEYEPDSPIGKKSQFGLGYTFPALFHKGGDNWILLTETGVDSYYCGSRLADPSAEGVYQIAYPEPGEFGGVGSANPSIALPGKTPWRTITVGDNLAPIVETNIMYDVVEQLYEPSINYNFGRSTWSWIVWQDPSLNWDDQVKYVDLASAMKFEYCLVDGGWMKGKGLGREGVAKLADYARAKNVELFLWYNSNGYWNDAPQDPKGCMDNIIARKNEMAWMKKLGVKGIKVDFFGSDKQQTIQLYEDILSDANDYGLMVIFHGCNIPRGWEKMYPNYVGSESVLASENMIFNQKWCDNEAYNSSLHPFIRNVIGSMEYGGTFLNKRLNRGNNGGTTRVTGDIFQLATAVIFQNPVQNFALTPTNLTDVPEFELDFMRTVPTTWDEVRYIDGYPGKYAVIARRNGAKWYIAGINAEKQAKELKLVLPMFIDQTVNYYLDKKEGKSELKQLKVDKKGIAKVAIPHNGGIVLVNAE